ncbi:MAG: LysR family transcriptional regulator [Pseudomonadales bacterium]|nr:LysR family transcriptional regulator [Pseudomonadales bacterium]
MGSRLHARIGTIRQLEILLAVYDGGSIKAAAESLHLTQPTVSMQLKKLVDAIGMPIYDQVGRRLVFTEAGLAIVATAREVLESFQRLDMHLSDMRGLKAGTLKLAVVTTSKYFIPHLLGPFCERYPNVDIQFKVGNREQIMKRLNDGSDDFYVFSHVPEDVDIDRIEFLPNPLVAIAAQTHPFAKKKNIDIKELLQQPFLMREKGSGTRHALEQFLKREGLKPNTKMTIESNEAIKHAVMANLGVSVLSVHSLAFGGDDGLAVLNVKQLPVTSNWYFVWLRQKQQSVIAETFLQYLHTEGREMLANEIERLR